MKRKLILLSATLLTLSVALAACSTSDSTQSAVSDTQSSSASSSVAVSSSSSSSSSERTYDFDSYILQYEKDNNLTDEEIQADENLKLAMFEWLRDAGVQVGLAVNDKYSGCENIFLDDYIKWLDPDSTIDQYGQKPESTESTGDSSAFTEEEYKEIGAGLPPKWPEIDDYYAEDGSYKVDEYTKAIEDYEKAYAEWHEEFSKKFEEYQQKKTDEAMAETAKGVEELGGRNLTGDEITEKWEKAEEFGNKVAEVIENGTIEEILNNVNN